MVPSTSTRTLTVNPAFLQEIKEVNEDLWSTLTKVRSAFDDPEKLRENPHALINMVGDLRDQLALHFALEEAFGYFEDPLEVAPRFSEQAISLRDEHSALYLEVCRICELAERLSIDQDTTGLEQQLTREFQSFDQRLHKHESAESDLILAAYDDDFGGGD